MRPYCFETILKEVICMKQSHFDAATSTAHASCWHGKFKTKIDYNGHTLLYVYALFKEGNKDTMDRVVMLDGFNFFY